MAQQYKKFKPHAIKLACVKKHYEILRNSCFPGLPKNCKAFQGFTPDEMDLACAALGINNCIFNSEQWRG